MPSTQTEAQARSGIILAFRPRAPDVPLRPTPSAPGWVPDELGMVRAVLLALAMAAGLCGVALALWGAPGPAPGRAVPACATAASGPFPEQVADRLAGGGAGAGKAGLSSRCPLQ